VILDEPTNGLDPPARQKMIRLIKEIADSGEVHLILSSHLLRDVEECCDAALVLKQGRIAANVDLERERRANKKFLELETYGDNGSFADAIGQLGCEWASQEDGHLKMVLTNGVQISDLYRIAAERNVQIRRLNYKRDSLQDIFLKAMEDNPNGRV